MWKVFRHTHASSWAACRNRNVTISRGFPAIAVEQKVNTRNPRSTVGTSTEIYDYLRMLFARIGRTFSPVTGLEVRKQGIEDIIRTVLSYPEGTRAAILVDIYLPEGRSFADQLRIYAKEGYSRLEKDGVFFDIPEVAGENPERNDGYRLLIDRISVSSDKDEVSRLTDSLETAYFEGHDEAVIKIWGTDGTHEHRFSKRFMADGIEFREPSDLMFNFNNPYGACPTCEGFGRVLGVSEDLVVPDKTKSVYQNAVRCWNGDKMSEWKSGSSMWPRDSVSPSTLHITSLQKNSCHFSGTATPCGRESTVSSDGSTRSRTRCSSA